MYAKDLEPYFVNKQETTRLTYQLHYILSNLIKDYALDKLEEFNKNTTHYEDLVKDINFKFLALDPKRDKRAITEKDLIRICFPRKDEQNDRILLEGKMSKNKLSVVYCYFDKLNTDIYQRGGSYWVGELNKDEQHQVKCSDAVQNGDDEEIIKTPDKDFTIDGAITINSAFRQAVEAQNTHFDDEDFYLSKNRNHCQWNGIIQGLYEEREIYKSVRDAVTNSFAQNQENFVSAVVTGARGIGKSTLLRKLAIDFIDHDFITLWVTNLELFLRDYKKLLPHATNLYLVIIEDWQDLASNLDNNSFFATLNDLENIRIVIGDTTTIGRKYLDFFTERHTYTLLAKENKTIIKKILLSNVKWQPIGESVLSNSKLSDSSLFVILFVIGKSYAETEIGQALLADADDFDTRFRGIIRRDQITIAKTYPGLAVALYYWASLLKSADPLISWDAFLQIADEYNGDEKISSRLLSFPEENYICKILRSYLSIEPSITLKTESTNKLRQYMLSIKPSMAIDSFENTNIFTFHHSLIIEAFSYPLYEYWPQFDNAINVELIDILIRKFRFAYAEELRYVYLKQKKLLNPTQNIKYNAALKDIKPFSLLRLEAINYYYDLLNAFLVEIKKVQDEQKSSEET